MKMLTGNPARKVWAATAGGGAAAAAFIAILTWYLATYQDVKLPEDVQGALVVLLVAGGPVLAMIGTFLAGYFTPPASRDQIVEK